MRHMAEWWHGSPFIGRKDADPVGCESGRANTLRRDGLAAYAENGRVAFQALTQTPFGAQPGGVLCSLGSNPLLTPPVCLVNTLDQ